MGFIKVTPEELRAQATSVQQGAAEVQDILQRLLSQVQDLASKWEGAGSSAFQDRFNEWQQGAQLTKQGMDGIVSFLNAAAQEYEDVDTRVASANRG